MNIFLEEMFEKAIQEEEDAELKSYDDYPHINAYLEYIDKLVEFEETLSEGQKELFVNINRLEVIQKELYEKRAFKLGYLTAIKEREMKN